MSRDTTESDLKQRREIIGGTLVYKDQPAVEAAIEGRILVLEGADALHFVLGAELRAGLEKCERNVLPVLNNLLENREMSLDDGRFLMRYASLRVIATREQLPYLRYYCISHMN